MSDLPEVVYSYQRSIRKLLLLAEHQVFDPANPEDVPAITQKLAADNIIREMIRSHTSTDLFRAAGEVFGILKQLPEANQKVVLAARGARETLDRYVQGNAFEEFISNLYRPKNARKKDRGLPGGEKTSVTPGEALTP
ncbi:MAG: hypothetical protein P4M13_04810 [Alphaproteobacteria bacterium]|nr:hypothetical protein [Alphaproteobacteria bacterium]